MALVEVPICGALRQSLSELLEVTESSGDVIFTDENWLQRTPPSAGALEKPFAAIDAEEVHAPRRIERIFSTSRAKTWLRSIFNTLRRDSPQSRPAQAAPPDADND